jgi:protein-tyrosine phosphatase
MSRGWDPGAAGVLALPSGRLLRGRGLRGALPVGALPDFGLYLLGREPEPTPWPRLWLRWPDFWLPLDAGAAHSAFAETWERAAEQRVEIGCFGGRGRTGTALACIAVLDGVPGAEAVGYVREHFDPRAVETPWQRWYVGRFGRR